MALKLSSEVLRDLIPRITKAAQEARDAEDAWRLRIRQRDELIVAAVDRGISQRSVADAAGISKGRVIGVLANCADDGVIV